MTESTQKSLRLEIGKLLISAAASGFLLLALAVYTC